MMRCLLAFVCTAGVLTAPAAWADVAPPDACFTVDAVCHNAGENYDQDGVCKATTCTKGPPGQQVTYDCFRCESEAGAAGAAGAMTDGGEAGVPGKAGAGSAGTAGASGGVGMGGGPATGGAHPDDDSGCSVGALGSERGIATLMLTLGLAALGISRRRR